MVVARLFTGNHWLADESVARWDSLELEKALHRRVKHAIQDGVLAVYIFERNFEYLIRKRSNWCNGNPPFESDITMYRNGSKRDEGTCSGGVL